jgi:hypothetical protein
MSRVAWIEAARRGEAGDWKEIPCPENDDDFLEVDWFPGPISGSGEYRIRCPSCGAENWIRES